MPKTTRLTITAEDRDLILSKGTPSPQLAQRLRFGIASGQHLRYDLGEELLEELTGLVQVEGVSAKTRSVRGKFQRLAEKLRSAAEQTPVEAEEPEVSLSGILPSDVREELRQTFSSETFSDLDEANTAIQQITNRHNNTPRREFQGLSPAQVTRLIYTEWNAPDSPIQINQQLKAEQLENVAFLTNARTFLNALAQEPAKATEAGNLNRIFIAKLLGEITWPPGYLEELHRGNKVINEEDAWPIHITRIILTQAGLIRKHKGSFRITKKGNDLRLEDEAGALYFSLFMAYFRKFNLAYLDRCPPCPGVQQTLGYSLYVIRRYAKKWIDPSKLAGRIYLPTVQDEFPEGTFGDLHRIAMETRIIEPLEAFGLLRCQWVQRQYIKKLQRIRTTPLYQEFMRIKP